MAGADHANPNVLISAALGSRHLFFSVGDGHQPNSGGLHIYIYTQEHLYIYGCTSTIGSFAQKNKYFRPPLTNLEGIHVTSVIWMIPGLCRHSVTHQIRFGDLQEQKHDGSNMSKATK